MFFFNRAIIYKTITKYNKYAVRLKTTRLKKIKTKYTEITRYRTRTDNPFIEQVLNLPCLPISPNEHKIKFIILLCLTKRLKPVFYNSNLKKRVVKKCICFAFIESNKTIRCSILSSSKVTSMPLFY